MSKFHTHLGISLLIVILGMAPFSGGSAAGPDAYRPPVHGVTPRSSDSSQAQLSLDITPAVAQVGEVFSVTITLADLPAPLAGYQFDLLYDPARVNPEGSSAGDLLAISGRTAVCPPATSPSAGVLRFACASTGSATAAANSGTLGIFQFSGITPGTSQFTLENILLADTTSPPGALPATAQPGLVIVGGTVAVSLSSNQEGSGYPGDQVEYTLNLGNQGTITDTFHLDEAGNNWEITYDPGQAIGPLAPGGSTPFTVTVTIPPGAPPGMIDTVTITASSSLLPSVTAEVTLATTALREGYSIYLPLVVR